MKKTLLSIVAWAALAGALFIYFDRLNTKVEPAMASPAKSPAAAENVPLSARAVLRIDPRAKSPIAPAPPPVARNESPMLAAYRDRRDLAGLQQQLKNAPETAETAYLKARLYGMCAKRAGVTPVPKDEGEFIAGLHEKDPFRDDRIAAYRKSKDICVGLDLGEFSLPEYERMLARAASLGDPRAQSRLLVQSITDATNKPGTPPGQVSPARSGYVVSPEQYQTLVGYLASGDPEVIQVVRGILSSSIDQGHVVFGADGTPIDPRAMFSALGLVACDSMRSTASGPIPTASNTSFNLRRDASSQRSSSGSSIRRQAPLNSRDRYVRTSIRFRPTRGRAASPATNAAAASACTQTSISFGSRPGRAAHTRTSWGCPSGSMLAITPARPGTIHARTSEGSAISHSNYCRSASAGSARRTSAAG